MSYVVAVRSDGSSGEPTQPRQVELRRCGPRPNSDAAGMTTLMGFPSPTELDARTPADRDRAIDVIRITALIGVVIGHTVMAISIIRGGVLIWDNLLTTSTVFQALTWIFQIMPLFFFAGAAACVTSWRTGANWGGWLLNRCSRLFRPVFYYFAFWAVALAVLYPLLPQHVYEPVAGISIQLLWFLGVYVLVLAAMPALYRITTPARLAAGVIGTYAMVAVIDAVRLHWSAAAPIGYLNLAAWLIPGMFGVAYRRQLITGAPRWPSRWRCSPSTWRSCSGGRTS